MTDPNALQQQLNQAISAMNAGDARRAADLAIPLLEHGPKHPDLLNLVGTALLRLGDFKNARVMLQGALDTGHAEPTVRVRLARAMHRAGDHEPALVHLEAFLADHPDNNEASRTLVSVLTDLRRFDDAETALAPMLDENGKPKTHMAAVALARIAEGTGKETEAIQALESHLADGASLNPLQRGTMLLNLGKLREKTGDANLAFEAFRQMNELDRQSAYDPSEHAARIDRLIVAWTGSPYLQGSLKPSENPKHSGEQLVFIVGMPRSGTTLVEQMLAAHPAVLARGECNEMPAIAAQLDEQSRQRIYQGLAIQPERATAEFLDNARAFYLGAIDRGANEGATLVTDKMPANALHLPLIAALFPKARVILCRRNPVDTCLSNYTQRFVGMHAHTNDLAWLGAYHNAHDRAVSAWIEHAQTPSLVEVVYEESVQDAEAAARTLCGFLGLEFDPAMAKPHEVKRVAATASRAQVQRPVHTGSVDRAAKFGSLLDPLREALAEPG